MSRIKAIWAICRKRSRRSRRETLVELAACRTTAKYVAQALRRVGFIISIYNAGPTLRRREIQDLLADRQPTPAAKK